MLNQIAGACSLCGSDGVTKVTCPFNSDAKHPNPKKHALTAKLAKERTSKCSLCGSSGVTMVTCPLNAKAKHPNAKKHNLATKRRSPSPVRRRSPSPSPVRRRSPSPSPVRRRSPSPLPVRLRSPSVLSSPSPSPSALRSPILSGSPLNNHLLSPPIRPSPVQSPSVLKTPSPSPILRSSFSSLSSSPSSPVRSPLSPSPSPTKIKVIGTVFKKRGDYGDFDWMIRSGKYENALFIYNDDEMRQHWKKAGQGNAVIRKYNKHALGIPRSAGIVTGTGSNGYSHLNPAIKHKIDECIDDVSLICRKYNYSVVYYSAESPNGRLGTSIFTVNPDVLDYITKRLHSL